MSAALMPGAGLSIQVMEWVRVWKLLIIVFLRTVGLEEGEEKKRGD
jgi:hypothetical protein